MVIIVNYNICRLISLSQLLIPGMAHMTSFNLSFPFSHSKWEVIQLVLSMRLQSGTSYLAWVLMCRVIISRRQAAYGHWGHLYGFSPVWVLWCVDRWSDRENTCPQTRQVYGLTPVWSLICLVSMSLRAKDLLHTSQAYDLDGVESEESFPSLSDFLVRCRDAMCFANLSWRANICPQIGQMYATSLFMSPGLFRLSSVTPTNFPTAVMDVEEAEEDVDVVDEDVEVDEGRRELWCRRNAWWEVAFFTEEDDVEGWWLQFFPPFPLLLPSSLISTSLSLIVGVVGVVGDVGVEGVVGVGGCEEGLMAGEPEADVLADIEDETNLLWWLLKAEERREWWWFTASDKSCCWWDVKWFWFPLVWWFPWLDARISVMERNLGDPEPDLWDSDDEEAGLEFDEGILSERSRGRSWAAVAMDVGEWWLGLKSDEAADAALIICNKWLLTPPCPTRCWGLMERGVL